MTGDVIPLHPRPAPARRVPAPPPDAARRALAAIIAEAATAAMEAGARGEKLAAADFAALAVVARNGLLTLNDGGAL
ncbi:hypothetical protein [Rhodospirillum centenum]|uniref:Uncharacterized protein n=1 Tax=Rhodospirillum centenum (strain ATCC 51521 / SW) TaxID=414684 RepID=B6IMM5_RHOCS|nr:hypothetical protein [Rhodospirillum centenum]ACI98691.1 phage-related hypothetical protein [Rhodospirillum centenum SW]